MSSDGSQATIVERIEGDDISKASTSKTALELHEDTPGADLKGNEQGGDLGSHNNSSEGNQEEEKEENAESKKADANTDSIQQQHDPQVNSPAAATAGDWQAIWSPQHNAYYFYNARTRETTWTNPIQPPTDNTTHTNDSPSSSLYPTSSTALYAAAEAAGIDPSLAHLDPTLVMPGGAPSGSFAAKFNARTGAFTRLDGRDPSFLSEAERAKRMSAVYFDVNAWESELEQRYEEEDGNGKKRKRPTKKDLVWFFR